LIQSFGSLAAADPSKKAEILSKGIAVAMNTTFLGLLSAISVLMIHSFIASKADKIISEIDEYSVKLIDLLTTKKAQE
jgi:biopolymer transport protein ExbB/TolQ